MLAKEEAKSSDKLSDLHEKSRIFSIRNINVKTILNLRFSIKSEINKEHLCEKKAGHLSFQNSGTEALTRVHFSLLAKQACQVNPPSRINCIFEQETHFKRNLLKLKNATFFSSFSAHCS